MVSILRRLTTTGWELLLTGRFKEPPVTTTQLNSAPTTADSPIPSHVSECVRKWVQECAELCQPSRVVWCDGSKSEADLLYDQGVREGVLIKLNQQKLPGCYLHRSNPNDV